MTLMNMERMPEPAMEKVMADDLMQQIAEEDAEAHGRACASSVSMINFEEDTKKIAKLIAVMRICQKIRIDERTTRG
jgi:ligand-binding sensor protein